MQLRSDFFEEEIICDHTVTPFQKRIWAVLLNLLNEFDIFCKKYDLKYFAAYGTILGAERHKGFVPWDDDLDVQMMRDEYARMQPLAREYFAPPNPIVYEDAYCDEIPDHLYFAKLRDTRTTVAEKQMIERGQFTGMFLDIFPRDAVYDGTEESKRMMGIRNELWMAITEPERVRDLIVNKGNISLTGNDTLLEIIKFGMKEKFSFFEEYLLSIFPNTTMVGDLYETLKYKGKRDTPRKWFRETLMLPFEGLSVPVPVDYKKFLELQYGDYMTPRKAGTCHSGMFLDPDTPFEEYLSGRKKMSDMPDYQSI